MSSPLDQNRVTDIEVFIVLKFVVSNLTCPWYVNLWHDMLAWAWYVNMW
jgi:hypothetical protein